MNKNLEKGEQIVKSGGIIIFPTDTAFGIGCRIDDEKAIRKLFQIRRRPKNKAVPVLVSSIEMAEMYAEVNAEARILMRKYWPGGLTIVIKCKKEMVPTLVRGGRDTIGVRMPKHRTTVELIKRVGVPILGPSANFAGEKTPYKFSEINPNLSKLVNYVISGKCSLKQASTVIDSSVKPFRILREGAVQIKN